MWSKLSCVSSKRHLKDFAVEVVLRGRNSGTGEGPEFRQGRAHRLGNDLRQRSLYQSAH